MIPEKLGERVVMVGSGLSGCESAIHLAKLGKTVTVLARRDRLAPECTGLARTAMLDEMDKVGVIQKLKHTTVKINGDGVDVIDPNGKGVHIPADSVVYAAGTEPGSDLAERLAAVCAQLQIRCSATPT